MKQVSRAHLVVHSRCHSLTQIAAQWPQVYALHGCAVRAHWLLQALPLGTHQEPQDHIHQDLEHLPAPSLQASEVASARGVSGSCLSPLFLCCLCARTSTLSRVGALFCVRVRVQNLVRSILSKASFDQARGIRRQLQLQLHVSVCIDAMFG